MPRDYKNKSYIYHLTALSNMNSIFRYGLVPRSMLRQNMLCDDVADPEIISYREEHHITNYVPFHFYMGTPFAWRVQTNNPNTHFIYIAIKRTYAQENNFMIIPMHPMSEDQKFAPNILDYDSGMEKIEWDIMNDRNYSIAHNKNVCMAECISSSIIPIQFLIRSHQVIFFTKYDNDKEYLRHIYKSIHPEATFSPYIISDIKNFNEG